MKTVRQQLVEAVGKAEANEMPKEAQALQAAIKAFEATQSEYNKCGAADTEPNYVFGSSVCGLFKGRDKEYKAKTAEEWRLYTSSMNCTKAANALNAAFKKVADIIKAMPNSDKYVVGKWLEQWYDWDTDYKNWFDAAPEDVQQAWYKSQGKEWDYKRKAEAKSESPERLAALLLDQILAGFDDTYDTLKDMANNGVIGIDPRDADIETLNDVDDIVSACAEAAIDAVKKEFKRVSGQDYDKLARG